MESLSPTALTGICVFVFMAVAVIAGAVIALVQEHRRARAAEARSDKWFERFMDESRARRELWLKGVERQGELALAQRRLADAEQLLERHKRREASEDGALKLGIAAGRVEAWSEIHAALDAAGLTIEPVPEPEPPPKWRVVKKVRPRGGRRA